MMACDDQTPEDDAASTVSVTKIHSWLREKRCDQSRCGGMLKKEGAHLESSVCRTKVRSMNLHAAQTSCSKSESSAMVWSKSESNKRNCVKNRAASAMESSPPVDSQDCTYQFGQKDRPEASEMLVVDPTEEHSKTQVDLRGES